MKKDLIAVSDGRVYYLICKLRGKLTSDHDWQIYRILEKEWNRFMRGPDSLMAVMMTREQIKYLRYLEMLLAKSKDQRDWEHRAPCKSGASQRTPLPKEQRRPMNYWTEKMHEILHKNLAGKKPNELAVEYKTDAPTIYYCLKLARDRGMAT